MGHRDQDPKMTNTAATDPAGAATACSTVSFLLLHPYAAHTHAMQFAQTTASVSTIQI